jgi:hypothetical protein
MKGQGSSSHRRLMRRRHVRKESLGSLQANAIARERLIVSMIAGPKRGLMWRHR